MSAINIEIDNSVILSEVARALNCSPDSEVLAIDFMSPADIDDVAPIRLDAMAIVLCMQGEGSLGLDLSDVKIEKNTLLVIQPNNYIRYLHTSPDFRGCTIICSTTVVQSVLPKLTDLLPLLMKHRLMPATVLTDEEAAGIKHFYSLIKNKLDGPRTHFIHHKVISLLQAALFEMMDIRMTHENATGVTHTRREEIMARFILALSENFRSERQVSYYARQLCITPKHLSTVVRETSGSTAGEWIDSYVMMEAKMLLRTTDLTIQEIATRLHFPNQSFFGKYFKHHAGKSPSAFRIIRK